MTTIQGAPRGHAPASAAASKIGGELAGSHPANGVLLRGVNGGPTNAAEGHLLTVLEEMYRERSGYVAEVDWRHHR